MDLFFLHYPKTFPDINCNQTVSCQIWDNFLDNWLCQFPNAAPNLYFNKCPQDKFEDTKIKEK